MKVIWKFPLPRDEAFANDGKFGLTMPRDARILCVQVQDGAPCLWAELYDENQKETRQFCVVGTGHEVPPGTVYVGTWQDGPFVRHLYEKKV